MEVVRPATVGEFMALAARFLEEREAEHNLIFGIASTLGTFPDQYADAHFAVVLDGDEVAGAALRTPPYNLVLSESRSDDAVRALADGLVDTDLPGVTGSARTTSVFVDRWTQRTSRQASVQRLERIYRLREVGRPRPAPGSARLIEPGDKPLLVEWLGAFAREALDEFYPDPGAAVDRWLSTAGFRQGWIWDDEGPVSFAGISGLTPHGIRLGPVYTPPEHRRRGYAGNVVAAASQAQLDRGREFVFLFTDLANPTSNHVYGEIGYEPVIDISQWRFEPGDDRVAAAG